jgi:hypothetical protein
MTLTAFSRAAFLTLLFPRIISAGRRWYSSNDSTGPSSPDAKPASSEPLPTSFADLEPMEPAGIETVQEPTPPPPPATETTGRNFDLVFLRASIFVDAALTALLPYASKGWHLFLAAGILPLASGSAPAAKGVVTEMLEDKAEQADALSGLALIECTAMMATISLNGYIFSLLSLRGVPERTFFVNSVCSSLSSLIPRWR